MNTNEPIDSMLETLQRKHREILQQAHLSDSEVARALLREAQEVLFRINVAQNLVLEAAVASVQEAMTGIAHADARLTNELKKVNSVADVVTAVTKFLVVIDEALDLAKKAIAV